MFKLLIDVLNIIIKTVVSVLAILIIDTTSEVPRKMKITWHSDNVSVSVGGGTERQVPVCSEVWNWHGYWQGHCHCPFSWSVLSHHFYVTYTLWQCHSVTVSQCGISLLLINLYWYVTVLPVFEQTICAALWLHRFRTAELTGWKPRCAVIRKIQVGYRIF